MKLDNIIAKEIVHNPSYDVLFNEELKEGQLTELDPQGNGCPLEGKAKSEYHFFQKWCDNHQHNNDSP